MTNHSKLDIKNTNNCSINSNQDHSAKHSIALRTIPVILKNNSTEIRVNAFLDDVSNHTFITEAIASQLNLEGENVDLNISILDGNKKSKSSKCVNFDLISVQSFNKFNISAFNIPTIAKSFDVIDWCKLKHQYEHLEFLPFAQPCKNKSIDILIGLDHTNFHTSTQLSLIHI